MKAEWYGDKSIVGKRHKKLFIVGCVDKLMCMIGELEKQASERKEQSERLMQAVLREAFEGKT